MASSDPQPKPKALSIASDSPGANYQAAPAREVIPVPANLDDRDLILREQFSVDDLRLIALWLSGFTGDYYRLCRSIEDQEVVTDFTTALTARLRAITRMSVTQPGGATAEED